MKMERLPAEPKRFFQLEDDYDRRSLKRAYGKAIRIYKPESHPNEFRLIRDAYESLVEELRFAEKYRLHLDARAQWTSGKAEPVETTPGKAGTGEIETCESDGGESDGGVTAAGKTPDELVPSTTTPSPSTTDRRQVKELSIVQLAIIDPEAAAARLAKLNIRRPIDYYTAAVLTDVIDPVSTHGYLEQLLDGLAAYPGEPGLESLVMEHLRSDIEDRHAAKMLVAISKRVCRPDYYRFTLPLWIRVAKGLKFPRFKTLLFQCEQSIHRSDPVARAMFRLEIMDVLVWTATPDWIQAMIDEIEREIPQDSYYIEYRLDFLRSVVDVRHQEHLFTTPLRKELLAICRLVTVGKPEAQASARCRLQLIGNREQDFLDSFPMDRAGKDRSWLAMLSQLFSRIAADFDVDDPVDADQELARLIMLRIDLHRDYGKMLRGSRKAAVLYRYLPSIVWNVGGVMLTYIFVYALNRFVSFDFFWIQPVLFGCLFALYYYIISPRFFNAKYHNATGVSFLRSYENHWRKRLFRFLRSSTLLPSQIAEQMMSIPKLTPRTEVASLLKSLAGRDVGLAIYGVVRRTM